MRYWRCSKLNKCMELNNGRWTLGEIYETDDDGDYIRADNGEGGFIKVKEFKIDVHGVEFEEVFKMNIQPDANVKPETTDAINPQHYKNCSIECIDAMMMAFGTDWVYKHCILTAWKYMWRYQNKNGVEDIKKARWYVNKAKELIPEYLEWQNINEVLKAIERDAIVGGAL